MITRRWVLNPWTTVGFALAFLLLLAAGFGVRQAQLQGAAEATEVERTLLLQDQTERVLTRLVDAETGQRGYLLTGAERYLTPYEAALIALPVETAKLHDLGAGSPDAQRILARLDLLMNGKLDELRRAIDLRRRQDTETAPPLAAMDAGKESMDRIRAVIEELQSKERSDLRTHQALQAERRTTNRAAVTGTIFLAAMLAGVTLLALNRLTRRRMIAEEQRDRRAEAALEERKAAEAQSDELLRTAGSLLRAGERLLSVEQATRLDTERMAARLGQLQALTAGLGGARSLDDVVQATLGHAPAMLGAVSTSLYVYGADRTTLDLLGQVGFPSAMMDTLRSIRADDDRLVPSRVARTGQPTWIEGSEEMLESSPATGPAALDAGVHSGAALPLRVRGRTLGAVSMGFSGIRRLSAEERSFALMAADQCAQALDRARAYEAEAITRAAAEAANRTKDDFLSTLSHELRTPLTSILGWANMLRTRAMEPAATARALATIERNARTQVQLIEDILDVSRIVAGKLRLEIRPVDAAAIVRAAVSVVLPAAEAKGVRLEAVIDDAAGTLGADPDRLQQVAWNLLSNAVKFTPRGSAVEVRLDRHDEGVRLRVIDHGTGIDAGFLPHVFERFRQADASSTRSQGGLGLGLAIVKHLVELHGGTITAESAGAGQGATFTVTLPAGQPGAAVRRGGEDLTPPPQRLDGVRVVLVDDEPDTRELLAAILQDQGATVTTAASAREALCAVERDLPHVLVSDIGLPEVDGYALLQQVRALPGERARGVAALALTAFAGPQAARTAELAGFQKHLAKPVLPARLIDEVARLVSLGVTELTGPPRAGGDAREEATGLRIDEERLGVELVRRGRQLEEANERLRRANERITGLYEKTRRDEEALRAIEDELSRAQVVAHTGSWWLDTKTNVRRLSEEGERILGITKGTPMVPEEVLARIHPDDLARATQATSASQRGEAVDVQLRLFVRGEMRWLRLRTEPDANTQTTLVGTVQEITDFKHIEEALAQKEQRRRELFEGAPDGILVADRDGHYLDANPAACGLLGFTREELLGMNITQLVAPDELTRQAMLEARLQAGEAEVIERPFRRKDGTIVLVELRANRLPDGRMLGFFRDVTARREAEDRLRLSEAKSVSRCAIGPLP